MDSPRLDKWRYVWQESFEKDAPWREECNGFTTDGVHWYVVSNREGNVAIRKFTLDFSVRLAKTSFPGDGPLGSPDYHQGRVYVPVTRDSTPWVWILDANIHQVGLHPLPAKSPTDPNNDFTWCAINPWNKWLYTSNVDGADRVYAYDPAKNFAYQEKRDLVLQDISIDGVHAGRFSDNGHLYLLSDPYLSKQASQDIRGYSAMNGAYLGSCGVSYDPGPWASGAREEMPSLDFVRWERPGNVAHVHVLILDNDTSTDDVFIQHFAVPDHTAI
jgi:hypothetical protein